MCPTVSPTKAVFQWLGGEARHLGAVPGAREPEAAALIHAKEGAQVCPVYL